jgi:hypothetical protein
VTLAQSHCNWTRKEDIPASCGLVQRKNGNAQRTKMMVRLRCARTRSLLALPNASASNSSLTNAQNILTLAYEYRLLSFRAHPSHQARSRLLACAALLNKVS